MWIAKRVLDGAVDAGIVQNDSPRFVAGVHIHSAFFMALDGRVRVSYVGSLETPRPRRVDIYV